ncbi:MAG: response regulator [Gammaproteobacteria bacterium]|nr:response regulator [Gammaproteobacteria bacterium]
MYTILLVEDNEMNRDMLSRRLQLAKYRVETAIDGQQAIEKSLSIKPDLILMDLDLPVINGWDATQMIKTNSETAHIPIIALTAHAFTEDREKALKYGCDDYDIKPVDFNRLDKKMQKYLIG